MELLFSDRANVNQPKSSGSITAGASDSARLSAFTLIELLAVIALLVLSTPLLVYALTGPSLDRSKAAQCLGNLRQLMYGMHQYSSDNKDFFPPNPDDANSVAGHLWCVGIAGPGGVNEYDPDILQDEKRSLIFSYAGRQPQIYRCPADLRPNGRANGSSATNPAYAGKKIPSARTVSMSQAVGTVCRAFKGGGVGHNGPPIFPVDGPWLTGAHQYNAGPYNTYGKASTVAASGPAMVWALLDENVVGENDATFAMCVNPAQQKWVDYPGYSHGNAGAFAFLDGHAEIHKWTDSRTLIKVGTGQPACLGSRDWAWMAQRTSALKTVP